MNIKQGLLLMERIKNKKGKIIKETVYYFANVQMQFSNMKNYTTGFSNEFAVEITIFCQSSTDDTILTFSI